MTGAEVKAIREALGRMLGRHVSLGDLGLALGLAPANAKDTVRRWEEDGPTGPAAVALTFMREATDLGTVKASTFAVGYVDSQDRIDLMVRKMFEPQ